MPPNVTDLPIPSPENEDFAPKLTSSEARGENDLTLENGYTRRIVAPPNRSSNEYKLKTFMFSMNLLAHILIGAVTSIAMLYAFRNGLPLAKTPLHIVLCVTGYQLLMAEAILSLSTYNGWSQHLRLVDKRRAHLVLQILGSVLAITGSFIKILDKTEHWTTLHGQFALVALVFTTVSLVNGITSLWAHELRKYLPANISKLTHICFGTVAFSAACICLCFGFAKVGFMSWITDALGYTAISFTATLLFIVIISPLASFYLKSKGLISR